MLRNQDNSYTIKFSIKYQTSPGQNIYIYGNIPELGNWKESKLKLKWTDGHIWKGKLDLPNSINHFLFKYVCLSDDVHFKRWEDGPDRIFNRSKYPSNENIFRIDSVWEHFTIQFNIFYPLSSDIEYMQVIGGPKEMGHWFKDGGSPIKMHLSEVKTLGGITGKFWQTTLLLKSKEPDNYEFEYRYSIYNPLKGSAVWEREPNRKIKILTDISFLTEGNGLNEILKEVGREIEFLSNGHIERLDVNFVAHLKFDKIGDFNIYIGPYPQNEEDIRALANQQISAVLNVQTDLDMLHRQINWQNNLTAYKKNHITIIRHPIRDFDQNDLKEKLIGVAQELKELLSRSHTVYVHCTAGMSRAAATVIAYLVFYESFSLEEAYQYVKTHRSIICPNLNAISEVVLKNKLDDDE